MIDALITAIVFMGIYQMIKVLTDYWLKKRIVVSGHIDKAGILDAPKDKEEVSYPTLKWGLVSFFGGIGLLVIAYLHQGMGVDWIYNQGSYVAVGIELIAISVGFLTYFFIVRKK